MNALLHLSLVLAGSAGSDWPCWNGPEHNGVSRETGWSVEGKSEPLWRAQVGLGYSSFALQGGRLFTLGHDAEKKLDTVFCFDAESGKPLWTHSYASELWAQSHGGGTLSTPSADGEVVTLGNVDVQAIATPGHALAHHAYLVTDHTRADEPWLVLTGDALLVGDAGRPDLHAHGEHTVEGMARTLYRSLTEKLLTLPDHLVLYPSHYSGSVCGRGLSANPVSTVGFERRHNTALQFAGEDEFVAALVQDIPPRPAQQERIVAANRAGRPLVDAR